MASKLKTFIRVTTVLLFVESNANLFFVLTRMVEIIRQISLIGSMSDDCLRSRTQLERHDRHLDIQWAALGRDVVSRRSPASWPPLPCSTAQMCRTDGRLAGRRSAGHAAKSNYRIPLKKGAFGKVLGP